MAEHFVTFLGRLDGHVMLCIMQARGIAILRCDVALLGIVRIVRLTVHSTVEVYIPLHSKA